MNKISTLLSIVTVLIIAPSAFAGEVNMKEGLWDITSKMEMPGMPFPIPPMTHTQCITEKDMIPKGKDVNDQGCKIVDQNISNNTVTWSMNCSQDGQVMKSTGKITYSGTTFAGEVKMNTANPMGDGNMDVTTVMSGKYIGECNR